MHGAIATNSLLHNDAFFQTHPTQIAGAYTKSDKLPVQIENRIWPCETNFILLIKLTSHKRLKSIVSILEVYTFIS